MRTVETIVIGGGIAGLCAAYSLAARKTGSVLLLERAAQACTQASGNNAAIFRQVCLRPNDVSRALRTKALLDALAPGWLDATGNLLLAKSPEQLSALHDVARRERIAAERLSPDEVVALVPALAGGDARHGLLVASDGVIDVHAVATDVSRAARARGARLEFGVEVASIEARAGRVNGVRLTGGERVAASTVVVAAGAWSQGLGATCGAARTLTPKRRHLVLLDVADRVKRGAPVVWRQDDEVYFRPDSGGILASPCDEEDWRAETPPMNEEALIDLGDRIARLAPALAGAGVRHAWACLRTFAPDREPIIGEDPVLAGLFWLAGLGGHGMSSALAAAEELARVTPRRQ